MSAELPYLLRIGTRLSEGLGFLSAARKDRHAQFVYTLQLPDGGFRGREGDSDLYYTSFAVRTLRMLDRLPVEEARQIASYLATYSPEELNVIDLMNWLASAVAIQLAGGPDLLFNRGDVEGFQRRVASRLESVRTADGGYAKSTEGASGSTYHSFLSLLTYQLIGLVPPRPRALIQFIYDRQRDDGGFVEIAPMRRSGTNPTAAAAVILRELGAMDDEIRADMASFLRDVRSSAEGFQANTRIPFADSLSTFTALLTAQDLQLDDLYDRDTIRNWVQQQLEFPDGGFRAATWDDRADVEYTFYGLGVLALLGP